MTKSTKTAGVKVTAKLATDVEVQAVAESCGFRVLGNVGHKFIGIAPTLAFLKLPKTKRQTAFDVISDVAELSVAGMKSAGQIWVDKWNDFALDAIAANDVDAYMDGVKSFVTTPKMERLIESGKLPNWMVQAYTSDAGSNWANGLRKSSNFHAADSPDYNGPGVLAMMDVKYGYPSTWSGGISGTSGPARTPDVKTRKRRKVK